MGFAPPAAEVPSLAMTTYYQQPDPGYYPAPPTGDNLAQEGEQYFK